MAKAKKEENPFVPVEEQPYGIPENWRWVYIKSVFDVASSKRIHKSDWLSEGVPFYRTRELVKLSNDGYVNNELFISEELYDSIVNEYGKPKQGDLLISGVGTIGVPFVIESSENFYFKDGNVIWFQNHGKVLPFYLFYLYKSIFMYNQIHDMSAGTTVDTYTIVNANRTKMPLPPLAEQQRIVDRIESLFAKLDEAKEKAQAVVDGYEQRKAAILHQAFSGELTKAWRGTNQPNISGMMEAIQIEISKKKKKKIKKVNNDFSQELFSICPKEWITVELDAISQIITDGEHQTPSRVDDFCGYYLLSARNVHDDLLRLEDVDYVNEEEFSRISKRCNPVKGDILISCSGSVGRCCVISDDNKYVMVRSAAVVSPVLCNPRFVMYAIISDFVQEQIQRLTKQTAQANLFIGAIAAIKIPLSSIEEQNQIVQILDSLISKEQKAKETAESVIEKIDTMKKSILARAFRGELGTNDPADESAEVLLKNIL